MTAPNAPLRVLAVSGSLRAGSSNAALLGAAARLAPPGVAVVAYDGLAALPHFTPDLDRALDDPALPAAVRDLRARVAAADAMLISSPEYAHGPPGALKNALDWLVGGAEMPGKPVALLNASAHATHAQAALAETLRTMSAVLVEAACVTVDMAGRPRDAAALAADPEVAATLGGALRTLAGAARR